ncbi:hypothetical protein FAI40_10030 [Acetobacteraceae bacterium]|nr:hypothetical protein FAI40_10030 [Acetobacteraceae bacterium]
MADYAGAIGSDYVGQILEDASINAEKVKWGIFKTFSAGILSNKFSQTGLGRIVTSYRSSFVPNIEDLFPMANVTKTDIHQDYSISEAPQENGEFFSFNKVKNPLNGTVTFVYDGSAISNNPLINAIPSGSILGDNGEYVRSLFVQAVENAKASLEYFQLRTPEYGWRPVEVIGSSQVRELASVNMFEISVQVREVRETASLQFLGTATPSGASILSTANVQPELPNPLVDNLLSALP